MKRLFFAALMFGSVAGQAQSMLVMKTGKIYTFDDQGMIYDLGNFLLPYKIKEIRGRYIIDDKRKLRTIDRNGYLYNKEKEDKVPSNLEHFGENYFINKYGKIFTIDDQGYVFEAEKGEREFKKIEKLGGTFFVGEKKVEGDKKLAFFAITAGGRILEVTIPGLNLGHINFEGGNYFTTSRGELFSVSADGYVFSKKDLGTFNGWEMKKGGNYFIFRNSVYTVAQSGIVMSVADAGDIGHIEVFGTNFFITRTGALYTVSANGTLRKVPFNENLSTVSHFSRL